MKRERFAFGLDKCKKVNVNKAPALGYVLYKSSDRRNKG